MRRMNIVAGVVIIASLAGGVVYYRQAEEKKDVQPPVLHAESEELTVSIAATEEELTAGISAEDDRDKDVSDSILITGIEKKKGTDQDFEITYVAFDQASNMGTLTRTLHYSDYQQAHFNFEQQLRFPENQKIDLMSYFTAEDCIDGDVTPFITMDADAQLLRDEPQKGLYDCTLSITNSVGYTTTLIVPVEIYEDSYDERSKRPSIALKQYIIYIKAGEVLDSKGYLDHIEDKGIKTIDFSETAPEEEPTDSIHISKVQIESNVDTNTPGTYTVNYKYTSEATGYDCTASLLVVVE